MTARPDSNSSTEDISRRKLTFDEVPELYSGARPSYPDRLFDDLVSLSGLAPRADVLEIGCGPGTASVSLAKRGFQLVCVELGENLAVAARENLKSFPHAEVITSAFETWEPQGAQFDMVFASSSWHWLDRSRRYQKAASVLKPGGVLAIVTTSHVFPEGFDPFFTEIQHYYGLIRESDTQEWPYVWQPKPDDVPDEREDIESSGLFENIQVKRYVWSKEYSAQKYIDLLETYSDHRSTAPEKRAILYAGVDRLINARPDGHIRKDYLNILNIARLARLS